MVKVVEGDITKLSVDVIVNAANSALSGGGGVDGAIHRAAGPKLKEACRKLGRCPPGEVVITEGYRLPAKYVIHAVGPVWSGGVKNEAELLSSCYRKALALANQHNLKSIAFPAISCGAYRYPLNEAAAISIETLCSESQKERYGISIQIVCFDERVKLAFEKAYENFTRRK